MKKAAFFSVIMLVVLSVMVGIALASHNGAVVSYATLECGQTDFSVTIADPTGSHRTTNMRLVVDANASTQSVIVPTDGSAAQITVGPFFADTLISWNVFGGGERDYDQPLWNGYGGPTFGTDIGAYIASVGDSWVVAGPDDPNPFVNWNTFTVNGCPTKDECKEGGWQALGFSNQGECIQYVNTAQD